MSNGINCVYLQGNVGSVDIRKTKEGKSIVNLSLATSDKFKTKDGAEKEITEWHRVVFFNASAEYAEKVIKKGSRLFVKGRIKTSKYQDKNGNDVYKTEIIAENFVVGAVSGSTEKEKDTQNDFFNDDVIPF